MGAQIEAELCRWKNRFPTENNGLLPALSASPTNEAQDSEPADKSRQCGRQGVVPMVAPPLVVNVIREAGLRVVNGRTQRTRQSH